MTLDDRIRALRPLGFSPRQTHFLALVALHGGVCLRRQYGTFAGLRGKGSWVKFFRRLVDRKIVRPINFRRDRGPVYRLQTRRLYTLIGQADKSNPCSSSAAAIARKVMVFDYLLSQPDLEWYGTAEDKATLFTVRFGVKPMDLPQHVVSGHRIRPATIRYFVHKLPIGLQSSPLRSTFVFLMTDLAGRGFERFLRDHVQLLNALATWRLVVVAPRHVPGWPACQRAVDRVIGDLARSRGADDIDQLQQYFQVLDLVERDQLHTISTTDVDRFRDQRRRFKGQEFEVLFERWKTEGAHALAGCCAPNFLAALESGDGQITTYELPVSYDRFGTRPGIS